jgi:hypothetical protein
MLDSIKDKVEENERKILEIVETVKPATNVSVMTKSHSRNSNVRAA